MKMQEITLDLVRNLIMLQFPEWARLSIFPVQKQGHDNRTFRLGNEMLVRMPTAAAYALKVPVEQKLLPLLASHLSTNIPVPIKMGSPSNLYPYPFSIYKWLDGTSINFLTLNAAEKELLALDLAKFLNELHRINISEKIVPGEQNFWRGGDLAIYDAETRAALLQLKDVIDVDKATVVWNVALSSKWESDPVWIHGDFSIGNMLMKNGQLSAVIDFGGMAVGDPACDLVIAWTFLKDGSRKTFQEQLCLDKDTWHRAMGWALWKALITIASKDCSSEEVGRCLVIIKDIIIDFELVS